MKLTIPKRDLSTLIKHAVKAVERRNTIPILGNLLLAAQANSNRLSITATDLDIEVATSVACEVARGGSTTVPAIMLDSIVSKMKPDAAIIIDQEDTAFLMVKAARSRFKLNTLPVEDFPSLDTADTSNSFELPAADLSNLFSRTEFCISSEETRYYLNGIFLHHVNNAKGAAMLRAVATDGHRLSLIECTAPDGADTFGGQNHNSNGVIVPRKTVGLILSILKDGGIDKIGVQLNASRIVFDLGNVRVASKLIDGTFPDYQRVIPASNDKVVRLDRVELAEAVDRLSTISSARGRAAKFSLTDGKMTVSITNPDAGSAIEELDADYTGDSLDVGFNSLYVKEILAHVQGDQVELKLADPGSPALISGVDKPDAQFVAMPMRV